MSQRAHAPLFSSETPPGLFAQVAVDRGIDFALTYFVPTELLPLAQPGVRVRVPLGRSNRLVDGVLLGPLSPAQQEHLRTSGKAAKIKAIEHIDPHIAPLPADLIELARWISRYYLCPIGVVLSSMVPSAVKRQVSTPQIEVATLAGDAAELLERPGLSRQARAAYARLASVLAHRNDHVSVKAAMSEAKVSRLLFRRLASHGLVAREIIKLRPQRDMASTDGETPRAFSAATAPLLTSEQQAAMDDITPLLHRPEFAVRLIFGVTGSGKTEIYLRCLEKVVAAGRRGIVLVPDISLTTQLVSRFTARFEKVAVLHSSMTESARHQHWQAVAGGWADIVIGPRSAIFAPVANCGLIIVDEEHDAGFKQDNAPRYHARDVAIRRGQIANIPVLLGSATPSLETWHNSGRLSHFKRIELKNRPGGFKLPEVILVDMHSERQKRRGIHGLSMRLEAELTKALAQGRQAILLLNRRGWAHYLGCTRCQWSLTCEHCDAHMVVHRNGVKQGPPGAASHGGKRSGGEPAGRYVQCHFCLTSQLLPRLCPTCDGKLIELGQGTQRIEEELAKKFPAVRIARMDGDTMNNSADYQQILGGFEKGDTSILLGTQMVAKGLDFPGVGLVGVLDADMAGTSPDFRAAERTFDMVCQVAGRCGRRDSYGRVVVQSVDPHSAAIRLAARHDFESFAAYELPHRKAFGYPPYGRMARLIISHPDSQEVALLADRVGAAIVPIATALGCRCVGPQSPPMGFREDLFRLEFLLFSAGPMELQKALAEFRRGPQFSELNRHLIIDVDPTNFR